MLGGRLHNLLFGEYVPKISQRATRNCLSSHPRFWELSVHFRGAAKKKTVDFCVASFDAHEKQANTSMLANSPHTPPHPPLTVPTIPRIEVFFTNCKIVLWYGVQFFLILCASSESLEVDSPSRGGMFFAFFRFFCVFGGHFFSFFSVHFRFLRIHPLTHRNSPASELGVDPPPPDHWIAWPLQIRSCAGREGRLLWSRPAQQTLPIWAGDGLLVIGHLPERSRGGTQVAIVPAAWVRIPQ